MYYPGILKAETEEPQIHDQPVLFIATRLDKYPVSVGENVEQPQFTYTWTGKATWRA